MFKAIRELKRETSARLKRQNTARDEQGRTLINMTVRDDSTFLSPYSHSAAEVISSETAEFIRDSALGHKPKEEFALHIYSDCIDGAKQETYTDAIHSYFERNFIDNAREMFINTIQALVMFTIGVIALVVMIVAERLGWGQIWIECIDIFAWVFLWESVDVFFLERMTLRRRAKRHLAFIRMDVKFYPLSALETEN